MAKTSVYLNRDTAARWKASGLPLSELIRRGLDAPDLGAVIREIRDSLAAMPATDSTRGTDSGMHPLPLAAASTYASDDLSDGTDPCRHPSQTIRDDGSCGECGAELD